METQSNGHADLRMAIMEITAHVDKRVDRLEETLELLRCGTVTESACVERHLALSKRIDGKVDRLFFAGVSATLLFLTGVGGLAVKILMG